MDSSRVLLGLMTLARNAAIFTEQGTDTLDGVIAKGVLRSLLSALEFRDVATLRHCRRVAVLATGTAERLGWEGRQLKVLEVAALLHDVGKIGVPDNILFKPGKLGPDEIELMALHRHIAIDVLQACRVDPEVLEVLTQASNHFSGAGEGYQRIGSEVHQGARILSVMDAYDSLSTTQVYRQGKPHAEVIEVLQKHAGSQFDGNIVSALARWIETEGSPFADRADEFAHLEHCDAVHQIDESGEAGFLCHIFSYLYLLESLYDGFYLVDSDLRFVIWNHGLERLLGRPSNEMLGRTWTIRQVGYTGNGGRPLTDQQCPMNQVISCGKATTSQLQAQRENGRVLEVEVQSVPLLDEHGQLHGVAEIFRDMTRSIRRPQEFRELKLAASRDALTAVANRGELETQLANLLSEFSKPGGEVFSVIFLDVDHFKNVNDTLGHGVGDQVLIDMARLLQHETYSGELIGRYGGEEFVVLCPGTDLDQAVRRAERLRVALSRAEVGGVPELKVTASFGVSQAETDDTVESLLRRADKALYQAKERGRNRTCFQGQEHEAASAESEQAKSDPFVLKAEFAAVIAAEMVAYKLGGFVSDQKAHLKTVAQDHAVLQLGSRSLFGFWGSTADRQPVQLEIRFGREIARGPMKGHSASKRMQVTVEIRPLGRIRKADVFQFRAKQILKNVRAYFAAE